MKNLFELTLIASSLFTVAACADSGKNEKIAKELCVCMESVAAWNRQFQNAQQTGSSAELAKMLEELESITLESEKCADEVEKKYVKTEADGPKIKIALKEACPEVAEIIARAEKLKEE